MKRKRIKGLAVGSCVGCSFCKDKAAETQVVGGKDGGKTVCNDCYQKLQELETADKLEMSLGEEQAYRMYRVF